MEDNELTKIAIQRENVVLTLEHTGINQLSLDDMLSMFEGILKADTFVFEGQVDIIKEDE